MRAYAETGLVEVKTVNALLAFGEPMLSESYGDGCRLECHVHRQFRAWIRLRGGGRVMGHPWHSTPQFAATALLGKLRGRR